MKISEQEIEDWAAENPERIIGVVGAVVAARQYILPDGSRLDLCYMHREDSALVFTIAEIKAVKARREAVEQVLGYMVEWRETLNSTYGSDAQLMVVRGLIVAPEVSPKAWKMVKAIDGLGIVSVEVHLQTDISPPDYLDGAFQPRYQHDRNLGRAQEEDVRDMATSTLAALEEWQRLKKCRSLVPLHLIPQVWQQRLLEA